MYFISSLKVIRPLLMTCQGALDYDGNYWRIVDAIRQAKGRGATIINVPELAVTGYGCLDHFLEGDLYVRPKLLERFWVFHPDGDRYLHSWQTIAMLIENKNCRGILIDIGMPVNHRGVRYNCRVLMYDAYILLIRPKLWLANDGNYRYAGFWKSRMAQLTIFGQGNEIFYPLG